MPDRSGIYSCGQEETQYSSSDALFFFFMAYSSKRKIQEVNCYNTCSYFFLDFERGRLERRFMGLKPLRALGFAGIFLGLSAHRLISGSTNTQRLGRGAT